MRFVYLAAALCAFALIDLGAARPAAAQYSTMSCAALWHERNSIYAERGYCFKTPRAIAVFGERCYPPHGRLTPDEKQLVDTIKMWEARKGCGD